MIGRQNGLKYCILALQRFTVSITFSTVLDLLNYLEESKIAMRTFCILYVFTIDIQSLLDTVANELYSFMQIMN